MRIGDTDEWDTRDGDWISIGEERLDFRDYGESDERMISNITYNYYGARL